MIEVRWNLVNVLPLECSCLRDIWHEAIHQPHVGQPDIRGDPTPTNIIIYTMQKRSAVSVSQVVFLEVPKWQRIGLCRTRHGAYKARHSSGVCLPAGDRAPIVEVRIEGEVNIVGQIWVCACQEDR